MKNIISILFLVLFSIPSIANTYTVTTAAFGTTGDGISLRWAITQANVNPGPDLINFNISGIAPHTINCTSDLPNVTDASTVIDGSTQPANGYGGVSPYIILQGPGTIGEGLYIQNYSCEIYGLYIKGFNYGIRMSNAGDSVTIGSAISGQRNVISGNNTDGIRGDNQAFYFKIKGNYIGTGINGTTDEGNGNYGIYIGDQTSFVSFNDAKHEIGGTPVGERNVISGNDGGGIFFGARNPRSKIINNYIGTDVTGTTPIPNLGYGIRFSNFSSATANVGRIVMTSNVISNNTGDGVNFGTNGSKSTFTNNYIGVDATGTVAMGNGGYGIYFGNFASVVSVGGSCQFAGNVIADNGNSGIHFSNYAYKSSFRKNMIGVDATGTVAMGNDGHGIHFSLMTTGISVGASDTLVNNVISANTLNAIDFAGNNSMHTFLDSNKIGVDISGTIAMGNGGHGIYYGGTFTSAFSTGSNANIIGNIISNNGASGIYFDHTAYASWQKIIGNYIGVDATGTIAMGNTDYGIFIGGTQFTSAVGVKRSAQIGGTGANEGNIISANGIDGIRFETSGSPTNAGGSTIEGNIIGTDKNETLSLGNGGYGIYLATANEQSDIISCNTIAYNTSEGIGIALASSFNNKIAGNSIFCNAQAGSQKGIELNGVANNSIAAPVITAANNTSITGTACANCTVELFVSNEAGSCGGTQAEYYLDAVAANGAGNWTYPVTAPITQISGNVSAIAIDASNDASELSNSFYTGFTFSLLNIPIRCSSPAVLPIELLSFTGEYKNGNVVLYWTTTTEINNDYFTLESSEDAINWKFVGIVNGAGNSNEVLNYSTIDYTPFYPRTYYRLKQTDFDGRYEYFKTIAVTIAEDDFGVNIYPNPASNNINFTFNQLDGAINISIFNVLGELMLSSAFAEIENYTYNIDTSKLSAGTYFVNVHHKDFSKTIRLTIK